MSNILIIGCGDIGRRVAHYIHRQAAQSGSQVSVYGLVRSEGARDQLEAKNIKPVIADLDKPETLTVLPTKDAVIFHFAPPPGNSPGDHNRKDPRMRALLTACDDNGLPKKIILLSTTAVYGDCNGEWIDETAVVNPQTDRGFRRLDAEQSLRKWAEERNVPFVILRVSGIYGEGRLPVERIKKGLPILREDQSPFSNRIHQDDLALACVAASQRAPGGAIYNACDGSPSTMSHYFKSIAKALALSVPPEIDREQAQKELSAGMLSYLNESRRIGNKKLIEELQITLQYPNLEAGLKGLSKDA